MPAANFPKPKSPAPQDSQSLGAHALLAGFSGLAELPALLAEMQALRGEVARLQTVLKTSKTDEGERDGWIDATRAAEYLNLSRSTFDKYRYIVESKITGYKIDGKTLYKRADLDNWVKLYALKAGGFA